MKEEDFKILDGILNDPPYSKDFPVDKYKYNLRPGSMPASEFLTDLIDKITPTLIIEIGSYLGYSAVTMGNALKQKGINNFRIICIDTWLIGDDYSHVDSGGNPPLHDRSYLVNGYPTLYHQFAYNVIHNNLQNNIIPLPRVSKVAAIILKKHITSKVKVEADMIYVDGSHEDVDVYYDCKEYWPLIKSRGIMFGDDWTWDGVKSGVTTFAEENKLQIQLHPNGFHWLINKI